MIGHTRETSVVSDCENLTNSALITNNTLTALRTIVFDV